MLLEPLALLWGGFNSILDFYTLILIFYVKSIKPIKY